jgi:CubicO group peptidase (beta-lactamase class C family)
MNRIVANFSALVAGLIVTACAHSKPNDVATQAILDRPELVQMVDTFAVHTNFSGTVLVSDAGEVVLERAFNVPELADDPIHIDSRFAIASITKSFTAILTLQLVEKGMLDLEDSLNTHLPEFQAEYTDQVTIRQLLQNRSGILHYTSLPNWFDADHKQTLTHETLIQDIAELPLKFEPGTDYLYSNANFYLLGMVIERVTGRPYEAVLADNILAPAGLRDTGQIYSPDAAIAQNHLREDDGSYSHISIANPGLFRATASQFTTARDLFRLHTALQGETLLNARSKAELFNAEVPMAWTVGALPFENDQPSSFQSYNGELVGYTSMITRFPEHNGAVIILNNNNAGYETLAGLTLEIAAHLYAPN